MATNLNVTELDFDDIKQNLKNYLKQQTVFNDYDFDGSALSVLIDLSSFMYISSFGANWITEYSLDSALDASSNDFVFEPMLDMYKIGGLSKSIFLFLAVTLKFFFMQNLYNFKDTT